MVEEVQVGGAPAEHAEHWKTSEIVESALKYTALTFRKAFNSSNKKDILQRLKEISIAWNLSSRDKLELVETVKWYLSLNMNFSKSASPGVKTI